jgi:tetratricopeptide (TPR) repeat protein
MQYKIQIIAFFLLLAGTFGYSQNIETNKLRLADSYLNGGDVENALRVYIQVFDANPASENAFNGIKQILYRENRFAELLEKSLQHEKYSKDFSTYGLLGELYYVQGKADSAKHFWNVGKSKYAKEASTYSNLSNIQNKLGLYKEAVQTLLAGRERLSDSNLFADELSKMYIATNDYKNGIEEIIKLLYLTKRPEQAQGRIFALMENKEAKEYLSQYLKNLYQKQQNDLQILQIYSWYLRESGQSGESLEIIKKIDELSNAGGREIYNFSIVARNDGEYDIALEALQIIIDEGNTKENRYFSSALYNYAKTLDSKLENSGTQISKEQYLGIIKEYRNIIENYNNSSVAADALLRIAEIYHDKLNDEANAKYNISAIVNDKRFMRATQAAEAFLLLADLHIRSDNLDSAKSVLSLLQKTFNRGSGDFSLRAQYLEAEIEFYEGNAEKADSLYKLLGSYADVNIANDALQRHHLISQNKEQTEALKQFAMGLKAEKQYKTDEAMLRFEKSYMLSSGSSLANSAYLKLLEISLAKEPEKYLQRIDDYLISNTNSLIIDKILLLKADFLSTQKQYDEAEKILIKILTEFPQSIYSEEVREKITALRNRKV